MAKRFTDEDDALLGELGIEDEAITSSRYTPLQERIIAGFEEIQRFVTEHGRVPQHGEDRDIFERLYAVRLDRIRSLPECFELLHPFDTQGLLGDGQGVQLSDEETTDEELLAELGVEEHDTSGITHLRHVQPQAQRKQPKDVAQRTRCDDFDRFRPIFEQVQQQLNAGQFHTVRYKQNPDKNADVKEGDLFIIDGQKALVASMGESFQTDYERENRRLRVIYDNGTESNLLLRSLQRSLYKDENSRRILPSQSSRAGLFSDVAEPDDSESGYIYVVRSLSDHPFISEHRDVIHKIGVTGGDVKRRIGNAKKDATFLLADVEVVLTYKLANINRTKLERLIHRFFADARLDMELEDRLGGKVEPREWFLVPLSVIEEAIELLVKEELENYRYDPADGRIIAIS